MKKVVLFLANGFEEIEALGTIDILRRAGVEVITTSIYEDEYFIVGAHEVTVEADNLFDETDYSEMEMLILPGGWPGAKHLDECEPLKQLLVKHATEGKEIAAICAAPMVLGGLDLLEGKNATCYPSFEPKLIGANVLTDSVVVDGNITTGKGPGLVFDFALALVEKLCGAEKRAEVAAGLLL